MDQWKTSVQVLNLTEDVKSIDLAPQELQPIVIMTLLTYMYSGIPHKKERCPDFVINLYLRACKYQLLKVRQSCVLCLNESVNAENVGMLLVLAFQNNDELLKKYVFTYVYSNMKYILNSDAWKAKIRERLGQSNFSETLTVYGKHFQLDAILTVLSYLYSENLIEEKYDVDHVIKMYYCADNFNLIKMKRDCNLFFERVISIKNIGKFLMLQESCKDRRLKTFVQAFVSQNVDGILKSNKWKREIESKFNIQGDLHGFTLSATSLGPSTINALLCYIYFGMINTDHTEMDSVMKLYTFADKYGSLDLSAECVSLFAKLINIENVRDLLLLADKHQDKRVESCIQDYVSCNLDTILNSDFWKKLIEEHLDFPQSLQSIALAAKQFGSEIVIDTISYIHCRKLFNGKKDMGSLLQLYAVSKEHNLLYLKTMCESSIKSKLTAKDISSILVTADSHNDECLKSIANDFICLNAKELLNWSEWKDTLREHPTIVVDVLTAVLTAVAGTPKENNLES